MKFWIIGLIKLVLLPVSYSSSVVELVQNILDKEVNSSFPMVPKNTPELVLVEDAQFSKSVDLKVRSVTVWLVERSTTNSSKIPIIGDVFLNEGGRLKNLRRPAITTPTISAPTTVTASSTLRETTQISTGVKSKSLSMKDLKASLFDFEHALNSILSNVNDPK